MNNNERRVGIAEAAAYFKEMRKATETASKTDGSVENRVENKEETRKTTVVGQADNIPPPNLANTKLGWQPLPPGDR